MEAAIELLLVIHIDSDSTEVIIDVFESLFREHLNKIAPRVMAVLNPLKVVITNYKEGDEEWLEAENNPEDPSAGSRKIPFSRELYVEKEVLFQVPQENRSISCSSWARRSSLVGSFLTISG